MATWTEANAYLSSRAANHGLSVADLLDITPPVISDNPEALVTFWQGKDISHIQPVSTHPHLQSEVSNVIPEDPSVNRSRGAEEMTVMERLDAWIDNQLDAIGAVIGMQLT